MIQIKYIFWLTMFLLYLPITCRKDSTEPRNKENEIQNNLIFTRQDGITIAMGTDYAVCCGIWETGYIDKNAMKILFYDQISQQKAGWKLFILIDEASLDTNYTLPTLEAGQAPVSMFINDIPTGNQLNSDHSSSSGTIIIRSFNCGPPVSVSLTIDATIGSEFANQPSVKVLGTFSCKIYTNPAPFGCEFSF